MPRSILKTFLTISVLGFSLWLHAEPPRRPGHVAEEEAARRNAEQEAELKHMEAIRAKIVELHPKNSSNEARLNLVKSILKEDKGGDLATEVMGGFQLWSHDHQFFNHAFEDADIAGTFQEYLHALPDSYASRQIAVAYARHLKQAAEPQKSLGFLENLIGSKTSQERAVQILSMAWDASNEKIRALFHSEPLKQHFVRIITSNKMQPGKSQLIGLLKKIKHGDPQNPVLLNSRLATAANEPDEKINSHNDVAANEDTPSKLKNLLNFCVEKMKSLEVF